VCDVFIGALVTSLERDDLLRALGCAIEGLLRAAGEVPELAAKVEPQLRELTVACGYQLRWLFDIACRGPLLALPAMTGPTDHYQQEKIDVQIT
jgi:hypothetical protein